MPVRCEDKDALVAYLYDEVDAGERARIETHLAGCGECRAELHALRAVRSGLAAWAPPERDLGFTIVDRSAAPRETRRWFVPAVGLAAAAALVLAAAAAIANLEVTYGPEGMRVRTGWGRAAEPQAARAAAASERMAAPNPEAWRAELASLERRLRQDFVAAGDARPVRNAAAGDVLSRVRALIGESETRQQRELALRLAEVLRDFDRQRQNDLVRIQYGLGQLERSSAADRELVNHLVRVSQQR